MLMHGETKRQPRDQARATRERVRPMKTCTTEGAIALIEHGIRCTADLSGLNLGLVVLSVGAVVTAILTRALVRMLF